MNLSLKTLGEAVAGRVIGVNANCRSVTIDSRNVARDALFVAIKGARFDGHDFVAQAVAAGAVAIMVEHPCAVDVPQVIVPDTVRALGALASYWRRQRPLTVIAVTGTNGKTTVKEMLASIFSVHHTPLATRGNLNNEIGVPLTLLGIEECHDVAVIEMGANHLGEIAYLSRLAEPGIALITNAGIAHLQGFGSLVHVGQAKGEIFTGLGAAGIAVINDDDALSSMWRGLAAGRRVITFGMKDSADIHCPASEIEHQICDDVYRTRMRIHNGSETFDVSLPLPGIHNVRNALAAAAAAIAAGATSSEIAEGLNAMQATPGRLQFRFVRPGLRVIDDTYNANPSSMEVALDVLRSIPGERILVLGDMAELGDEAASYRRQVGARAESAGVTRIYSIGALAQLAFEEFHGDGCACSEPQQVVDQLMHDSPHTAGDGLTVLVKGSRCMRMERVVGQLIDALEAANNSMPDASDGMTTPAGYGKYRQAELQ